MSWIYALLTVTLILQICVAISCLSVRIAIRTCFDNSKIVDRRVERLENAFNLFNKELSSQNESLGTALGHLTNEVSRRNEALGTAVGHLSNEVISRNEALGTAVGHLDNELMARNEALGTAIGCLRAEFQTLFDKYASPGGRLAEMTWTGPRRRLR
jgi:hypothetical protein